MNPVLLIKEMIRVLRDKSVREIDPVNAPGEGGRFIRISEELAELWADAMEIILNKLEVDSEQK